MCVYKDKFKKGKEWGRLAKVEGPSDVSFFVHLVLISLYVFGTKKLPLLYILSSSHF